MKTNDILKELETYAPLEISRAFIADGSHDNSGVIVDTGDEIRAAAFSLDLSLASVSFAAERGCNLLITHHPAIYYPVSSLKEDDPTGAALIAAIRTGISVISMHLNLDAAKEGIDESLAAALGAQSTEILHRVYGEYGYGRKFEIAETSFSAYLTQVRKTFGSERILGYGENKKIKTVASFCGGGAGDVARNADVADLFVTSDAPHHVIKEIIERGKNLILIPHYTAEEKGFSLFFNRVAPELGVPASYFKDERFC